MKKEHRHIYRVCKELGLDVVSGRQHLKIFQGNMLIAVLSKGTGRDYDGRHELKKKLRKKMRQPSSVTSDN